MSFSVPEDNAKYKNLVNWYRSQDKQERSRNFRIIFMEYLENTHHIMSSETAPHVSRGLPSIERVAASNKEVNEVDLESRFANIGVKG